MIAVATVLGILGGPSGSVRAQGLYDVMVSPFPDRSGAVLLQDEIVTGDMAVFVTPEAGITKVKFFLDGTLHQTENRAPWDFNGTNRDNTANLYDTSQIADGLHNITAEITLSGGGLEVVSVTFTVANSGPALLFSPDTLSFAVEVDGSDSTQVNLDTNDATVASYTLSGGASWLTVSPLSGSTPDNPTVSVDATGLAVGTYTATVSADATGYVSDSLSITLNVVNTLAPDQVHLAWVDDPSTRLTIVWRTLDPASPSTVEYRPLGDPTWQSATGAPRPSGTQGTLHEVTLTSLTPSTTYEYRVLGGGSTWSAVFTTRTAPPPGPADFDAIYVADTGIEGRLDGLTTGTQQVIDEIANLNPLVVLLGGDYAYYNTDNRFATLDEAIDAWFNQMQPISTQSPMMPTYGNHEILLGEGYAPWADRFPTPEGFDNRKNYSFDVGDVHFVSIMAVSQQGALSAATVQWIQQDITDALNAGQTWVVPFFHVSPFADGKNHSSNLNLRAQLGPLFESLGVKVVISSHDQAYERTYPLTDVPATNTPTSASQTCYTMADGVTWVKVSPGGKLSNKNGNFSQFATQPPPAWTAFRDNTMHHFTRLIVSASGSIQVDTYGVIGDGTPPLVLDSFQYTVGACPPELQFSPDTLSFTVNEGGSDSAPVNLDTNDATVASYTVSDDAGWLTVSPLSGSTPDTLTISVDGSGLAAGTYTATVSASASGYLSDSLAVTLTVGGAYNLMVSPFPDRSGAVLLQDETVSGDMAVFVTPEAGITKVKLYLDGVLHQTEKYPPWDFNGTNPDNTAKLYDTSQIADGLHTISADIFLSGGGNVVVSATFTVANSGPALQFSPDTLSFTVDEGGSDSAPVNLDTNDATVASYTVSDDAGWLTVSPLSGSIPDTLTISVDGSGLAAGTYTATVSASASGYLSDSLPVTFTVGGAYNLMVSPFPDRSGAVLLQSETVSGDMAVFVNPETAIARVRFLLDGVLHQSENRAPWDFNGTAGSGDANLYNSGQLLDGPHTITAEIDLSAGGTEVVSATFTVANSGPALQFSPDTLSFTVNEGGSDSAPVNLDTNDATVASYTVSDDAGWLTVSPLSGSTPDTLTISVDGSGLAAGTYTATVSASASGYLSDSLAVTLNVGGSYALFVSPLADRSGAVLLQSETISGDMAVFVSPETAIARVRFLLDGVLHQSENLAPWDFNGTAGSGDANLYNSGQLLDGPYTITAEIDLSAGGTEVVSATFLADNGCSLVPCSEILVELPYELDYDHRHDHGKIPDANGIGTGFTYIDPPTNGTGYIPSNLFVDLEGGTFQITTTAGLALGASNAQDNALAVGVDAPSQTSIFSATLLSPPAGTGNDEQAGLWFGTGEDDHVKLAVVSTAGGTIIEYLMEVGGSVVEGTATGILDLSAATVELKLRADPTDQTIVGFYSIDGGPSQTVGTFTAPSEFFSFDAAGINPVIGTRSFGGIFASHASGPGPLVYTFQVFSVAGQTLPTTSGGNFTFKASSFPVSFPTSLAWGPDDRLYVTEMFGTIHALTYDADNQVVDDEVITTLLDDLGARLTLGITVDPLSTPSNVILWVSHSSPSLSNGVPNSGMISRISGPNFTTIEHIITGLPRAIANHATNSIDFGPDDRLYIAQGGNTGAGAPNASNSEFGDMEEQPLSAAILVADVRDPAFDGSCNNPDDIFGPPPCDVVPYATGLRNAYDFVFHSNGSMYAPDNGLGLTGTFPPSPTPPCFGLADTALHNPGSQPDELFRIEQGKYYGHPNPYRDECVFKDGSFQGVPPLPNWVAPIYDLGKNKSANGTIEYTSDAFCGALQGDLLIANYSVGDDITVIRLSADGLAVTDSFTLIGGFQNPLPLALGPDGTIYVGEHGGGLVTALEPIDIGCWSTVQPLPQAILDAGGTALDGKLYTVGGKTSAGYVSTMYIYDPATDTWTSGPDLPGAAVENPAVVALNGKLYVFGGSTAPFSGAVTNAAVFDPLTSSWTILTPMSTGRGGATAQAINGMIYVVGGMDPDGVSLASVEVYDPATDSWSTAAPMSTPRDNPGSAVLGGKLYIFGGRTRGSNATLSSVEMYDPASDTWIDRAPMPTGRRTMVVGTLNGRAQVMGGEQTGSGGSFEENEEYDPVTNTWRTLTPMPTPRHGAVGGTINGAVYVAGGGPTGGSAFTDVVEVFSFAPP